MLYQGGSRRLLFACVLASGLPGAAIAGEFTVNLGEHPFPGPMCWQSPEKVKPFATFKLVDAAGKAQPAQSDDAGRIWWWSDARKSGSQTFRLEPSEGSDVVVVKPEGDEQINVTIDGQPFTTLHFKKDESRPYLYPVIGPTDDPVTRHWPMKDLPEEKSAKQQDHNHHRSIWTAHGDVRTPAHDQKGTDYWATDTSDKSGKVVHSRGKGWQRLRKVVHTISGPVFGEILAEVDWTTDDGKRELSDTRRYRFFGGDDRERVIDYELVLHFPESDVTFAATKEGGLLASRVAPSMTEEPGQGHMVNSKGRKSEKQCWGEEADWCDYVGPVNGKTLGIAIFDAPSNFRHPTRWHIRGYGLYTANPFINQASPQWKKGESVALNYRVIIHKDDTKAAQIAEQYGAYAKVHTVPDGK